MVDPGWQRDLQHIETTVAADGRPHAQTFGIDS